MFPARAGSRARDTRRAQRLSVHKVARWSPTWSRGMSGKCCRGMQRGKRAAPQRVRALTRTQPVKSLSSLCKFYSRRRRARCGKSGAVAEATRLKTDRRTSGARETVCFFLATLSTRPRPRTRLRSMRSVGRDRSRV
jgi:hypothetical protein